MASGGDISRQNGKKGGRPKAAHTLQAEHGKAMLIQAYLENIQPINQALVDKAKAGDIQAIKELHDRVYGKSPQPLEHSGEVISKIIKLDE